MSDLSIFHHFPPTLLSVCDVEKLIAFVDQCVLCRGQNKERYISYILQKKRKLMDHSGTCTCRSMCVIVDIVGM